MSRYNKLHCEECDAEFEGGEKAFTWLEGKTERLVCESCFEQLADEKFSAMSLEEKAALFDCEALNIDYGFHIGMGAYI